MGTASICITEWLENGKRSTQYSINQSSNKHTPVRLRLQQLSSEWKRFMTKKTQAFLLPLSINSRIHTNLWFLAVNIELHLSVSYQTILWPRWRKFLTPARSPWVTWKYNHNLLPGLQTPLFTQKFPSSFSSLGYKLGRFDPSISMDKLSFWCELHQEMILTLEVGDKG